MLGHAQVGQHAGRDARMEGLDPAIEHLWEAGHVRDVCDVDARVAQRPRRPTGRDHLEADTREARRKRRQRGLVRHGHEGASRPGRVVCLGPIDDCPPLVQRHRAGQCQGHDAR